MSMSAVQLFWVCLVILPGTAWTDNVQKSDETVKLVNVPIGSNLNIFVRDVNRFRGNLDTTSMQYVNWSSLIAAEVYRDAEILFNYFGCEGRQLSCDHSRCKDNLVKLLMKQDNLYHVHLTHKAAVVQDFSTAIGRMFSFVGKNKHRSHCETFNKDDTDCANHKYKIFVDTNIFGCVQLKCTSGSYIEIPHFLCKFKSTQKIRSNEGSSEMRLFRSATDGHETCSECPNSASYCIDGLCTAVGGQDPTAIPSVVLTLTYWVVTSLRLVDI